jgi:DNA-binding GntR family transcriptional regulator
MPSERQLVDDHGVSRNTARQALQALADQGLIRHVPEKGYLVLPEAREVLQAQAEPTAEIDVLRRDIATITQRLELLDSRLAAIEDDRRSRDCTDHA